MFFNDDATEEEVKPASEEGTTEGAEGAEPTMPTENPEM